MTSTAARMIAPMEPVFYIPSSENEDESPQSTADARPLSDDEMFVRSSDLSSYSQQMSLLKKSRASTNSIVLAATEGLHTDPPISRTWSDFVPTPPNAAAASARRIGNDRKHHQPYLAQRASYEDLVTVAKHNAVTAQQIVEVIGKTLQAVCDRNDSCVLKKRRRRRSTTSDLPPQVLSYDSGLNEIDDSDPLRVFRGSARPSQSLGWYLWRMVSYLDRYPEVEEEDFYEPSRDAPPRVLSSASLSDALLNAANNNNSDASLSSSTSHSIAMTRGMRSLLIALVYVDRVHQKRPNASVTSITVFRLMLAAVHAAAKFSDDRPNSNKFFARVGGVSVKELDRLEVAFLHLIEFDFWLTAAEFEDKCVISTLSLAVDAVLTMRSRQASTSDVA